MIVVPSIPPPGWYGMRTPATIPNGSTLLVVMFVVLVAAVAGLLIVEITWSANPHSRRRTGFIAATIAAVWMTGTALLASVGALHFDAPPTMLVLLMFTFAGAIALGASRIGEQLATRIPVALLVGFQAFRIGVELLLHQAYREGLMPIQMSYSGRNLDILSGISGLILGLLLLRRQLMPSVILAWNVVGVALLANILAIAMLSAPTPFRVFMNEPSNVWITRAPWVWLPTVFVFAAILGHVVVFRWVLAARRAAGPAISALPGARTSAA